MAGEKSVVVALNNFGLEMFTAEAVELDESDQVHNVITGTEYAVLDKTQSLQFIEGNHSIELQDEHRYLGAFALSFTNPDSRIESQTA